MDKTDVLAQFLHARFDRSGVAWSDLPDYVKDGWLTDAKEASRLAAAEPVEPVAWRVRMDGQISWGLTYSNPKFTRGIAEAKPLYERPQPAPALCEGVEIKPLEWDEHPDDDEWYSYDYGNYGVCDYVVYQSPASDTAWCLKVRGHLLEEDFASSDAAKAAAQADYERRIRSALTQLRGAAPQDTNPSNQGENHDAVLASDRADDEVRQRNVDRRGLEPGNANHLANEQDGNAVSRLEISKGCNQGLEAPDAPQADQNAEKMREAVERVQSAYNELSVRFSGVHSDDALDSVLLRLHAALKALTAARGADGEKSDGDLNQQARNPVRLPDSSGDLASAGGIAGNDVTDHCRQVGGNSPSDPADVTVEEVATLLIDCWKSGKAPLQVARALIAKYSITKRTTGE